MALFSKKQAKPEVLKRSLFTIENQNGLTDSPNHNDFIHYLDELFSSDDQFVTLALKQSKDCVNFVQACVIDGSIIIQLGLDKDGKTKLVEKTVSTIDEYFRIFNTFFAYGTVDKIRSYKPVKMM